MAKSNTSPNLKPKRGLGSVVTRQRRKVIGMIDKEREHRQQVLAQRARQHINGTVSHAESAARRERLSWCSSFLGTVAGQQTAVLRSYGMTQPVHARLVRHYSHYDNKFVPDTNPVDIAYTDFSQVVVRWNVIGIPDAGDYVNVIDTIATMRGVFQHEFGHLRHTVPYPVLIAKYAEEKGLTADHYLMQDYQWAWNALEDQRMESLVVQEVPRMASYFTSIVLNVLLNSGSPDRAWLLLAGRLYLPDEIRYYARNEFGDRARADEWYNIVKDYKTATTATDMVSAVIRAHNFLRQQNIDLPPQPGGQHRDSGTETGGENVDISEDGNSLKQENDTIDEFSPQSGDSSDSAGDDDGDSGSGKSADDEAEDDAKPTDGAGNDSDDTSTSEDNDGDSDAPSNSQHKDKSDDGSTDDNPSPTAEVPSVIEDGHAPSQSQSYDKGDGTFKHAAEQMLEDVTNQLRNDADNINTARDININYSRSHIPELSTSGMPTLSQDLQSTAHSLAAGIETALSDYVTASQPHWVDRVDEGVINPLAFRTKDIGSYDYRRDRIGDCVDGLDLHVSFLSDVSVSMEGGPMASLSVAMYAMVLACERMGIGTTCTLWSSDTETYRIWDNESPSPVLLGALGGTDPSLALDDLSTHNPEGAKQHLVFIFTDGEWGYTPPLSDTYGQEGRRIVVVRYGVWFDNEVQDLDEVYGSDALININDVTKLPEVLHSCISEVLSESLPTY